MKKPKSMGDRMKEFGKEASSQEETAMMNTRVPKRLLKALKLYTVQNETTIQSLLTEIVEKELKNRGAL